MSPLRVMMIASQTRMRRQEAVATSFLPCLVDCVFTMSCSKTQRTFFKDLQQLYKTIEASTDGQATILGIDEMSVNVSLRPKSGCNAHAEFVLNEPIAFDSLSQSFAF
ncbi:hypothetical protein EGR_09996 [Echinococcus granulosus]|uniref:Uncharacterized protein n=1 Tax=Echinococcus granulosus TaxID=6210 RepID=W6U3I9_ECHGR|nr:hypothetical protein EGR_09996 [Echinococcus granulosus]EUB55136.1 hypothetical protein EGR_09996 [Echinococcus granulosus]